MVTQPGHRLIGVGVGVEFGRRVLPVGRQSDKNRASPKGAPKAPLLILTFIIEI